MNQHIRDAMLQGLEAAYCGTELLARLHIATVASTSACMTPTASAHSAASPTSSADQSPAMRRPQAQACRGPALARLEVYIRCSLAIDGRVQIQTQALASRGTRNSETLFHHLARRRCAPNEQGIGCAGMQNTALWPSSR